MRKIRRMLSICLAALLLGTSIGSYDIVNAAEVDEEMSVPVMEESVDEDMIENVDDTEGEESEINTIDSAVEIQPDNLENAGNEDIVEADQKEKTDVLGNLEQEQKKESNLSDSDLQGMEYVELEKFASVGTRNWKWPVAASNTLSSCYLDGREHYALDIVASNGTSVYASYDGTIIAVFSGCPNNYAKSNGVCTCGKCGGLGNYIYIKHNYNGTSFVSRYGHLSSIGNSYVGKNVSKGTEIGKVGATGNAYGFHLDFRIYQGSTTSFNKANAIDPFMDQFLEYPSGLNANGATTSCCKDYVNKVKTLYNTSIETNLSISGANSPSTLTVGSVFSITGTVNAGSNLTNVTVGCYDVNDNMKTGKSVTPNATSYNIKNLDNFVYFNNLTPGVYSYKVTASTASKSAILVNQPFIVLAKTATVEDGTYYIRLNGYGVCVAQPYNENQSNIHIWTAGTSKPYTFYIHHEGNGYYSIRNAGSGLYMDVQGAGTTNGTNVWQYTNNGHTSERWQILPIGSYYCLVPQCATSACLDVSNGKTENGVNMQIWKCNFSWAQRFTLTSADCNFESGNKVSFDLQGGTVAGDRYSYDISGFNKGRGTRALIVYNVPGINPNTNQYGRELQVNSDGKVIAIREYGSTTQLKVSDNGMIISGHNDYGAGGIEFVKKINTGNYVGVDYSAKKVYGYKSYDKYLLDNKYVASGQNYGSLPTPTRAGYIFEGWYASASGGSKITSSSIYSVNKLYAHWKVATPKAVTGLGIKGRAGDALRLSWNKSTDAKGYIIEQYKNGEWNRIARIGDASTVTYRVEKLKVSTNYKFRVKAFHFDSENQAVYSSYAYVQGRTNPKVMSGVKIGGRAANALRINWTKNDTASGYIIDQKVGSAWKRIARISGNNTTTYRVENLAASTTYDFRIQAFGFDGSTALYGSYGYVSGKTNPKIMSGVKIGGRAADALRINWSKNDKAAGYIIEQQFNGVWSRIARIADKNTITYRVEMLSPTTIYNFRMRAFDFDGSTPLYGAYVYTSGTTY